MTYDASTYINASFHHHLCEHDHHTTPPFPPPTKQHGADTTGLDLSELDHWWDVLRNGRGHEYKGEAVNPAYLSPFERWIMRYHKSYDPQAAAAEEAVRWSGGGKGCTCAICAKLHYKN